MRALLKTTLAVGSLLIAGWSTARVPAAHGQAAGQGGGSNTASGNSGGNTASNGGSGGTAASPDTSKKPTKTEPIDIQSVSPAILKKYLGRRVQVKGIIGDHQPGDTGTYNFHTDDGSNVNVHGVYPEQPQVTYTITARVEQSDGTYYLTELSKVRSGEDGGEGGLGGSNLPFLVAGVVLIVAALVTLGLMSVRNKAAQQVEEANRRADEERRRAVQAAAEAERARREAMRSSQGSRHEPTVAAGGAQVLPVKAPANTIQSIGSIVVVEGPHAPQKFPLAPGETKIGRRKENDVSVVLDRDGEVSGYHGSIIARNDGRLTYRDASTNGSIVDGTLVHHNSCEIHSGSRVEIGASALQVTLRTAVSTPTPASGPSAAASPSSAAGAPAAPTGAPVSVPDASVPAGAPAAGGRKAETVTAPAPVDVPRRAAPTSIGYGAFLEVTQGPDRGRQFPITRTQTSIGREDADILLTDDSISRRHATLNVLDGRFLLTDDNSTHGTRVNDEPLRGEPRPLADGDQVTMGSGRTMLLFRAIVQ